MEKQLEVDRNNFGAELDKWVHIKLKQIEKERKRCECVKLFVAFALIVIGVFATEYLHS